LPAAEPHHLPAPTRVLTSIITLLRGGASARLPPMIGLRCGSVVTEIGPASALTELQSAISTSLESGDAGSRFPSIARLREDARFSPHDCEALGDELRTVIEQLRQRTVPDFMAQFPGALKGARHGDWQVADMSLFFRTTTGRDLLEDALLDNAQCAVELQLPVLVVAYSSLAELARPAA
jgi:Immunity protein 70